MTNTEISSIRDLREVVCNNLVNMKEIEELNVQVLKMRANNIALMLVVDIDGGAELIFSNKWYDLNL